MNEVSAAKVNGLSSASISLMHIHQTDRQHNHRNTSRNTNHRTTHANTPVSWKTPFSSSLNGLYTNTTGSAVTDGSNACAIASTSSSLRCSCRVLNVCLRCLFV